MIICIEALVFYTQLGGARLRSNDRKERRISSERSGVWDELEAMCFHVEPVAACELNACCSAGTSSTFDP